MSDRIRFGEPEELIPHLEKLPFASLLVAQPPGRRDESFQVYIVQQAYDKVWQHVTSQSEECGGTLAGHPFRALNQDITFVVIVDAIPQDSGDHSIGHFTVRPREIADARLALEQEGYLSVGWYHSHPGHGVFLSGQDMTIVRSIYNSSWHIAWVIDPRRREEAFFQGIEGSRLSSWYLLREEPPFVRVNAEYKKGEDALKAGGANIRSAQRIFGRLRPIVDENPDLLHWQNTERYEKLINVLELSTDDSDALSSEKGSRISFAEDVVGTDGVDLLESKIPQCYDEAKRLLRRSLSRDFPDRGEVKSAQQGLEWIKRQQSSYPDYPWYEQVSRLVDCVEKILPFLEFGPVSSRRLTWSEEKELKKKLRQLRQLLG